MYAQVVVDTRTTNKLDTSYTYALSPAIQDQIVVGQLVLVNFGRRPIYGLITELHSKKPDFTVKAISQVISIKPLVSQAQIKLAHFISSYYHCSIGQALFSMIPPFALQRIDMQYCVNQTKTDTTLSSLESDLVNFINHQPSSPRQIYQKFGKEIRTQLQNLFKKKIILKNYRFLPAAARERFQDIVTLNSLSEEQIKSLSKSSRQKQVYEFLLYRRSASWLQIRKDLNSSKNIINSLEKKKIVTVSQERLYRSSSELFDTLPAACALPDLSKSQLKAWKVIQSELQKKETKQPILLFGRTGSGKTELYLRAVRQVLDRGQSAIILVPEIALVPQTLQRFYERFGRQLAVYHSKMSDGERFDEWQRILSGEAKVVIGSRSALLLPLCDLGLIVVDEEHEYSYKQDMTPRYHAVTAAKEYAKYTNSLLILGSATPRLETFWAAKKGEFNLIKLSKTINESIGLIEKRKPQLDLIDLREEFAARNYSLLSYSLQQAIKESLEQKRQILLFLNRRGHATYVFCRECGYVANCPNCSVSMTYHVYLNSTIMTCHHCGLTSKTLTSCPECSSHVIKFYGAGTEKLHQETAMLFPQAKIVRMDFDTTRGKNSHEMIFSAFKNHQADILIGTQMIAKGWDIPNVDLIGIINADAGFHLPDFRSTERNFSLLLQLIGRVGRGQNHGKILLQTYEPENDLYNILRSEDYQLFAFSELLERKKGNFPPFTKLVRLLYESTDEKLCKSKSLQLFQILNQIFHRQDKDQKQLQEILGPSPAFIAKIKNKHRWHIILKGKNLQQYLHVIPPDWTIDVDPYSIL